MPAPAPPRLGLSTACLAGSLEDKLGAAAAAGFSTIELLANDLLVSSSTPRQVRAEAARLGMGIEVLQPLHVEAVTAADFDRLRRRAQQVIAVVRDLGADVLLLCSTRSAGGLDDDDLAVDQLRVLADMAAGQDVRLAYEAVPWGRVSDHRHAWRLVERADHPHLGLCLDSVHVLSRGSDPSSISDIPGSKIFHVQLADAPHLHLDDRASLHERTFPGQGALDVRGFVRQLVSQGYSGPMALEVFNDVYQQEDPRYAATGAMRAMNIFAESVGRLEVDGRERSLFNAQLPPTPGSDGFAFVELAVDEVSEPVVIQSLTALGFAHTGQHRSKPVQLWQHGDVRLLLNRAPHRSVEPASAAVCALGVETSEPKGFAARASRLLAPRLPRLRAADESDLDSVGAPDGTAVFFCDSTAPEGWLSDFTPTGAAATAPLLSSLDHVALTETIDDFDQTAVFYQGVLGLQGARTSEVTAPFGPVRTWTAAAPDQRFHVSLSTAPLRRGDWAPAVSSPQHIGFATDDAVACARALREAGAPPLPMPGNYYDDLESRWDLPRELVDDLRDSSILYDRDDDGGEYLHFYTQIVGSKLFFEVVQRTGGYGSLGASTATALRMSAHRRHRLRAVAGTPDKPVGDPADEPQRDYSLAHLTALSLSPPELVDAASAAGYRYVGLRLTKVTMEEPHYPLMYDPALLRATKTRLSATGVGVLDIELARLTSGDSPRDFVRFLETGADLGARHVITQLPDGDFGRKVDKFAELCALARPFDLTVDLEFPSWTETSNLSDAARVLREADASNAGLLVDLLHFARSGSSIEELRELPPEWFHFVHVCDAAAEVPTSTEELIHTARFERLFPGEGGIDVHGILAALPDGLPYALEIPKARMAAQVGGREHARMALTATRRHLEAPVRVGTAS
jgi:4-hydroxyphenylpyruvate dioxygenase-like putative hemolysin/sugar phosphate isomerase/epimerase